MLFIAECYSKAHSLMFGFATLIGVNKTLFTIFQPVNNLEQLLSLNISIEYLYFPYQRLRPGFPWDDLYRAHFYPAFMVHQKDKPGRKPVFGPGNGYDCFVDSQDIGH